MIDRAVASRLLDFGVRIGAGQRADEQLDGAVALHNLLESRRVAYLADEVGMGKTYVALGALALFRHFQPNFRVLVIAPRENIQNKWMKELRNFVAHNVRFADLRVKGIDDRPARPLTGCKNLLEFVSEVTRDPNRDFFLRLSSFSLAMRGEGDGDGARDFRRHLKAHLPWLDDAALDLRDKQGFKDNFAAAVCCAIPKFDLVIVDEGHNLKRGFHENVSARNRVLALMMGRADKAPDSKIFRGYGRRAARVLFLSATPVEDTYRQLWNQLDVFGMTHGYDRLQDDQVDEETKKELVGQFLIRRVTSIRIGDEAYTKNLYRREWRKGGVEQHDQPIKITDPCQRLSVALVQKKVSEVLGSARFNSSFQIGMLASFESFLETAGVKKIEADESNFDDAEQTDDQDEQKGIDVADVNGLARSHWRALRRHMPHPKMDALVAALSNSWRRGEKSLVFVRRIASVKELKRKLDESYDEWLIRRLERELPPEVLPRFKEITDGFQKEKSEEEFTASRNLELDQDGSVNHETDNGGTDTFFAWFFRGKGPSGVRSGALIQRALQRSTFFEDNYVAAILGCSPGEVEATLAEVLDVPREELRIELRERSKKFLTRKTKLEPLDRFEAVQGAAVERLTDIPGKHQIAARIVWHARFQDSLPTSHAAAAPEIDDWLEHRTFFTELRLREALRARLWPESKSPNPEKAFQERTTRAQLLAAAARLGHSLVDLYVLTIRRLGSLNLRVQEAADEEGADRDLQRIHGYLDLLEKQMLSQDGSREWSAFDELAEISAHFGLILDCNAPDAMGMRLPEKVKHFGQLLGRQQPVGGMYGQLNPTLVRQFRMPGYPLVLVTTDLLQEGEDLHTFCSSIHHYGISWTPSSMEQRIGRIDRVRSQTDRRLSALREAPSGDGKLQVHFPHLQDTVEVLQVERVLERMNVFLRLMHEGLLSPNTDVRTIDVKREFAMARRSVEQIGTPLVSAFRVRPEWLQGEVGALAIGPELAGQLRKRLARLRECVVTDHRIEWEDLAQPEQTVLFGTAQLERRIQPFMLLLRSFGPHPALRCISPVGRIADENDHQVIQYYAASQPNLRVGLIETQEHTYHLTVESDVLLTDSAEHDAARLGLLLGRVLRQADDLEHALHPEQDAALPQFRKDLEGESHNGR